MEIHLGYVTVAFNQTCRVFVRASKYDGSAWLYRHYKEGGETLTQDYLIGAFDNISEARAFAQTLPTYRETI